MMILSGAKKNQKKMSEPTINEKSHFKISLPMAIQAIGLVLVLVYGYRDLESRIRLLEVESEFNTNSIKEMVALQEKPIPSDIEQNQRLDYLEAEVVGNGDDLEYLKIAGKLLKDSGIKTKIIRQYLPIMNKLVNSYLTAMDSYFNFELDENFNEIIKSRYRDIFSYASFSEGEKMRIDLALLFTWRSIAKMKNSANTNLLILDEVFDSSLDSTGTEEFLKLLHTLGSNTNVYIISHKGESLYEKFEHVIRFEKVKNFSKVV